MGLEDMIRHDAEVMAEARMRAEEDRLFGMLVTRVGRALAEHHANTGVQIKPGAWKIVVSRELEEALRIYARRVSRVMPSFTALEEIQQRLGGIDIVGDDDLVGDDIRLRAEIVA